MIIFLPSPCVSFSFFRIFLPAFCLRVGMQCRYLTRTRYATAVFRTCRASSERALGIAKHTLFHRRSRHGFRCWLWEKGEECMFAHAAFSCEQHALALEIYSNLSFLRNVENVSSHRYRYQ